MTPEEVLAALDVQDAIPVAWTSKDGTLRDDDGDAIDRRQTVPYVWALGPFGSWPTTLEDARKEIGEPEEWFTGDSFRLGCVATWKPGWGFQIKDPERR